MKSIGTSEPSRPRSSTGPSTGGKTTNLQVLHRLADPTRRGELVSIHSTQDRTILMDLLPMKTPAFRGFGLRMQVLAVPGQPAYDSSRGILLEAADSIVFVANSASGLWEETLQSFREMNKNLLAHGLDPSLIPVVFQYNKQDLPDLTPLAAVLKRTMMDLAKRDQLGQSFQSARGVEAWTADSVRILFGGKAEAAAASEAREAPGVRVQVKAGGVSPHEGAGLEESCATAAAMLASKLEEMRDERDRAVRHLDELSAPVDAAQELLSGGSPEDVLRRLVERVGSGLGASQGELVLARGGPLHRRERESRRRRPRPRRKRLLRDGRGSGQDPDPELRASLLLPSSAPLPSSNVLAHLSRLGQSLALALELTSGTAASAPEPLDMASVLNQMVPNAPRGRGPGALAGP